MSKRHLKTAMLWFMGACITFYLIGPSEFFHKCIGERKNTQPFQALHEGDRILVKFILRIQLNMVCGFVSSDANAGMPEPSLVWPALWWRSSQELSGVSLGAWLALQISSVPICSVLLRLLKKALLRHPKVLILRNVPSSR